MLILAWNRYDVVYAFLCFADITSWHTKEEKLFAWIFLTFFEIGYACSGKPWHYGEDVVSE